jgi:hypothetical protein
MANPKYDGVIEAVHYTKDGQVDWVRAFLRRGPTWSDRVIMKRQDLIDEIKSGRKVMLGKRVKMMGGTFEVSSPVQVSDASGKEVLVLSGKDSNRDQLEGVPVI